MSVRLLYLVHADLSDGDRLDLFVWANDPREARDLWRNYYADRDRSDIVMVCEVPTTPGTGVVRWDEVPQIILRAEGAPGRER
jgi:hypothetical protein